ncbi:MAG: LamG domain-containing protein, partial [Patescibacteria group bacterium]|nr:LamG domain-containing protein [Patescibacteria group bacterium]
YYYTYSTGTSSAYELTSYFESDKYQSYASTDGGVDPTTYEVGTNLTLTPFLHGLVGYWPLNEGSGTTAYDESGWGNEGTLGSTTSTDPGPTWKTNGCLNNAPCLYFDGVDDYDILSASQIFNSIDSSGYETSSWTLIAWAYATSTVNDDTGIIGKRGCNSGLASRYGSGYTFEIDCAGITNGYAVGWFPSNFLGNWHLIADVYSDRKASLYADGNLIGTYNFTGTFPCSSSCTLSIGNFGEAWFFHGLISNARIYATALSGGAIKAVYSSEAP